MTAAQEALVESFHETALKIAAGWKLPRWADRGCVEGAALEGLVRAARSYERGRGATWTTHANNGVTHAIQDACRRMDHLGRRMREAVKAERLEGLGDTRAPSSLSATAPGGAEYEDLIADPAADQYEARDNLEFVKGRLARLPMRERQVVFLSFFGGLGLREIGVALGVSESRACVIRGKALAHMKGEGR